MQISYDFITAIIVIAVMVLFALLLWRILAPKASFFDLVRRFLLLDLLAGLKITGREFFKKKTLLLLKF